MTRGRPPKFTHPERRMVTAESLSFDILASLGYDYSEVFEEGRRAIIRSHLKGMYPGRVGLFKISKMDLLIEDITQEIDDLTEIRTLLEQTRENQANLMTLPEGLREQQIVFGELADNHLTREEVSGYFTAFSRRIERGESGYPVAKSVLKDIASRANGSGGIIKEIQEDMTPLYQENLVWNYLTESTKT